MMNEETLLKTLSTPGAIIVLMLWLHSRLAHVEKCMECLAANLNVELPKRKAAKLTKSILPVGVVGLALLGSGCAHVKQTSVAADGSYVESKVLAIWPATSAMDKGNVKQTKTTQGIGTEGASADGGNTNLVSGLSELRQILTLFAK